MSATTARRLFYAGVVLFVAFSIVTLAQSRAYEIPILIANGTYVAVGGLIVLRRPGNIIGLALVAYGVIWAMITAAIVTAETLDEAGRLDAAAWMTLLSVLPSALGIWLIGATWLLFPDGRTHTPRDRKLLWGSGLYAAFLTVVGVFGTPQSLPETKPYPHPFVDDGAAQAIFDALSGLVLFLFFFAVYVAARLIRRMRHGDPTERRQVLWIAVAVILYVVILMFNVAVAPLGTEDRAFWLIDSIAIVLIPLGIAVAIFRHRLYDIDVIVSKSVTYLGLAAAITLLYAAVVLVPLLVIGQADGDGGPGLLLPIVATAIVAVLFEPIRSRLQRWANRLVYGERATPHDILSQVTARLAETASDNSTTDLAQLLAEGTGADRAVVWLQTGDTLHPEGIWPADDGIEAVPVADLVDSESTESQLVKHGEQGFGALTITKPASDRISPADRELLSDVAAGAGLLLRNISLNRQLEERADQLRESRRRLIAAQDAERHRLERDLHDGAQQQVVALKVKLGIAKTIAEREEAEDLAIRLSALSQETQGAVDSLRAVAHGIYPPLLEAEGLEAALRAAERSAANGLAIRTSGLGRYHRDVEATAYFFLVEATERARMSGSIGVQADISDQGGELILTIEHDGHTSAGELAAAADRIDALGGSTAIQTTPNETTRITGRLSTVELTRERI